MVECVKDPLVPLMVKVLVVGVVLLEVITVIVEVPEVPDETETGFGLNDALVRDGNPLTLNETWPLNPLNEVTVIV